jgi:hypothetical protein
VTWPPCWRATTPGKSANPEVRSPTPSRWCTICRARSSTAGSSCTTRLVSAASIMPFSSKASRSGSSLAGSSLLARAVAAKPRIRSPNWDWNAAIRSLTGPGRAPISRAALAMKQPPGKVCRSRCSKNASHTAVSWPRPAGAASAGRMTSSSNIRAASATVASWSSCLEPKYEDRSLLLMPSTAARWPRDRPSSPLTVASVAATRKIVSRVRSPSARGRGGPSARGRGGWGGLRLSCGPASLMVLAT